MPGENFNNEAAPANMAETYRRSDLVKDTFNNIKTHKNPFNKLLKAAVIAAFGAMVLTGCSNDNSSTAESSKPKDVDPGSKYENVNPDYNQEDSYKLPGGAYIDEDSTSGYIDDGHVGTHWMEDENVQGNVPELGEIVTIGDEKDKFDDSRYDAKALEEANGINREDYYEEKEGHFIFHLDDYAEAFGYQIFDGTYELRRGYPTRNGGGRTVISNYGKKISYYDSNNSQLLYELYTNKLDSESGRYCACEVRDSYCTLPKETIEMICNTVAVFSNREVNHNDSNDFSYLLETGWRQYAK